MLLRFRPSRNLVEETHRENIFSLHQSLTSPREGKTKKMRAPLPLLLPAAMFTAMVTVLVRDALPYQYCSTFNIVQKGRGAGRKAHIQKNCRIPNSLTNALVKA